jgi:hypothetical protein
MTLRNQTTVRTLTLSLLLAAPLVGIGCWEPELKDAEIGCGVDAMVNAKCPNRPPVEAGPPSPDGSGDGGQADGGPGPDTAPPSPDTVPVTPDTAPISTDSAVDQPSLSDLAVDTSIADSAVDRPIATDSNTRGDSAPGSDALTD